MYVGIQCTSVCLGFTNSYLLTVTDSVFLLVFSERELMFMFAICRRPSVCRLSVCRLSSVVCRLSVCRL